MSKTSDLLAELDAEFGKKPKKQKVDPSKQTLLQRNSTGTISDLIADSNETAKAWQDTPGFEPVKRVTFIVNQTCSCCLSRVSYIGNEFTEFYNTRLKARVKAAEPVFVDSLGFDLPREVEEYETQVGQCASCVRLSRNTEDLLALVNFELGRPIQLSLLERNGVKH